MTRPLLLSLAAILAAYPLCADSVTTSDNLTVFGKLEQLDGAQAKMTARYPSSKGIESRTLSIPRGQILKIEFNATTFNPGAPPVLRPAAPMRATPAESNVVILRGSQREKCPGALVEAAKVLCGKMEFQRASVIRILLGGK